MHFVLSQTGDNDGRTFSSSIYSSSSHPFRRFSSLSVCLRSSAYVCTYVRAFACVCLIHRFNTGTSSRKERRHRHRRGRKPFVSPFRDVINCIIIPRCVRPQPKQMLIGHKSRPLRFVRATTSQEGSEPVCSLLSVDPSRSAIRRGERRSQRNTQKTREN